jgi:hypothetical protein
VLRVAAAGEENAKDGEHRGRAPKVPTRPSLHVRTPSHEKLPQVVVKTASRGKSRINDWMRAAARGQRSLRGAGDL